MRLYSIESYSKDHLAINGNSIPGSHQNLFILPILNAFVICVRKMVYLEQKNIVVRYDNQMMLNYP